MSQDKLQCKWVTPPPQLRRDLFLHILPLGFGLFIASVGTGYLFAQGESVLMLISDFVLMFIVWSSVGHVLGRVLYAFYKLRR